MYFSIEVPSSEMTNVSQLTKLLRIVIYIQKLIFFREINIRLGQARVTFNKYISRSGKWILAFSLHAFVVLSKEPNQFLY